MILWSFKFICYYLPNHACVSYHFQQYRSIPQCSETAQERYNEHEGAHSQQQQSWISGQSVHHICNITTTFVLMEVKLNVYMKQQRREPGSCCSRNERQFCTFFLGNFSIDANSKKDTTGHLKKPAHFVFYIKNYTSIAFYSLTLDLATYFSYFHNHKQNQDCRP